MIAKSNVNPSSPSSTRPGVATPRSSTRISPCGQLFAIRWQDSRRPSAMSPRFLSLYLPAPIIAHCLSYRSFSTINSLLHQLLGAHYFYHFTLSFLNFLISYFTTPPIHPPFITIINFTFHLITLDLSSSPASALSLK